MRFEDLSEMQQLAVAQAVYKRMGSVVSTSGDGLRAKVDEQVIGFYEATGAKSYDVKIAGQKVGTMGVTVSKETERTVFDLTDSDALDAWLATDEGVDAIGQWATDHLRQFVNDYVKDTGEIPPGVTPRTVVDPPRVKGTTLRVEPAKVARALRGELPAAVAGLLGGA